MTNSPNSSPTESKPGSETPADSAPEPSKLHRLKSIFDETPADGPENTDNAADGQPNAESKPGAAKAKPKALKELADGLGLSVEDLYSVEVPLGDNRSVKLGDLKHVAQKQDEITARELELEEERSKRDAQWTRAQQELSTLLSQLDAKAIKPEVREAVRKRVEDDLARERQLIIEKIPQWQDEAVRTTELQGMAELLKDFGISETFLTGSMNHKLFLFVRDSYLRKARIEKALAKVAEVKKPSTTGKSRPTGPAQKPNLSVVKARRSGPQSIFDTE